MTVTFDRDLLLKLSQIKKAIQDIGYDVLLDEEIDKSIDPDVLKMLKAKRRCSFSIYFSSYHEFDDCSYVYNRNSWIYNHNSY